MSIHSQLLIGGNWTDAAQGKTIPVLNPATGTQIGTVAHAEESDLARVADAADKGFRVWRKVSAFERYKRMRQAATLLRSRAESIARSMTVEQGKPLAEALGEILSSADVIDWCAEEGRRAYGRVIPARSEGIYQLILKEPVGPVAGFTPWNFPAVLAIRKIAAALGAGCSIVMKGPEETPETLVAMVRAFQDADVPPGVVNLVFGNPAQISEYLIAHPVIRKISFTGSTEVGKHLAALAGRHMKRVTMELGGHAPVLVFEDADLDAAAKELVKLKFRNAGQVCISPTRFLVQKKVYEPFMERFLEGTKAVKVGDGLDPGTTMGPLAHERRLNAVDGMVSDAVRDGARLETGGEKLKGDGYFYAPTVLSGLNTKARVLNEEPFGPVATVAPFGSFDDAVAEANRLPYGLAAFAYTRSAKTANLVAAALEAGMVTINHYGLALPEVPFGGVKDSGYGTETGPEALENYLNSKFVSQAGV